jgi:hypothetical protein
MHKTINTVIDPQKLHARTLTKLIETRHRRPKQECICLLWTPLLLTFRYETILALHSQIASVFFSILWVLYFSLPINITTLLQYLDNNMHRKSSRCPSEEQLTIDAYKNASPSQLQSVKWAMELPLRLATALTYVRVFAIVRRTHNSQPITQISTTPTRISTISMKGTQYRKIFLAAYCFMLLQLKYKTQISNLKSQEYAKRTASCLNRYSVEPLESDEHRSYQQSSDVDFVACKYFARKIT